MGLGGLGGRCLVRRGGGGLFTLPSSLPFFPSPLPPSFPSPSPSFALPLGDEVAFEEPAGFQLARALGDEVVEGMKGWVEGAPGNKLVAFGDKVAGARWQGRRWRGPLGIRWQGP